MPHPVETTTAPSVIAYARLLREMHHLIQDGKGDSEEAEDLADRMDGPWYAMTTLEQNRMRTLATSLNVLREGGPKRLAMTQEEVASWQRALAAITPQGEIADPMETLSFVLADIPPNFPGYIVPFLQSRCWEKLGDLETALFFRREADRMEPFSGLVLLHQLADSGSVELQTGTSPRF